MTLSYVSTVDDIARLVPYDKSWMIRMGVLDMLHGYDDINRLLDAEQHLGTDLQALNRATKQWREGDEIDVGESGTLYRFLQFAAWKVGREVRFIKRGTLVDRPITSDPTIVSLSIDELLQLDNGTSQWASIAALTGNTEPRLASPPYKLQKTYEAIDHWQAARHRGERWEVRRDETSARQAGAYIEWRQTGTIDFTPEQAEDYCFARAFDLITATEGEARWPSLRQHESDRIAEMEEALTQDAVTSVDHRVVQAVAMRKGDDVSFLHPECVAKSWPQFWDIRGVV